MDGGIGTQELSCILNTLRLSPPALYVAVAVDIRTIFLAALSY